MPDLITVPELRVSLAIPATDVDDDRDARLAQAIKGASAAVRTYCDRDFGGTPTAAQRQYEWDNSGFVDIDDAVAVTGVTYSIGGFDTLIAANQWRAEPFGYPVFTYIVMPPISGMLFSPAMGFNQNLDVLYKDRGFVGLGPIVKVDGTWGWPATPDDVKQATIWVAAQMAQDPNAYASESIANYSRASLIRGIVPEAIPERARDLLAPYVRMQVS